MTTANNPLDGLAVAPTPERHVAHNPISPKQEILIRKLLVEKDLDFLGTKYANVRKLVAQGGTDDLLKLLTGGWGGTGSELIDALFKAPRVTEVADEGATVAPAVPAGYYGVDGKRYRVDAPDKGKWAGWIFFKTGSDYYDQQRLGSVPPGGSYRGKAQDVFETIAADVEAAGQEYARITGNCYACNRKLEDPTSVSLGIGPICRNK